MSVTVSGRLFLNIISAANLPSMDIGSHSDPFVVIKVGKQEIGRTKTVDNNNNPVWKQDMHFDMEIGVGDIIVLEVYDEDTFSKNDFIGKVQIPFQTVRTHRADESENEPITVKLDGAKCKPNSSLTYTISFKKYAYDSEVARLEAANRKYKEELKQLEEENQRLAHLNDQLENEVVELGKVKTSLQTNVEKFTVENEQLTKNRQNLELEHSKFQSQNVKLKENIDHFQEQNGKLKVIVDQLGEENLHFHHEVERLSQSVSRLEDVKNAIEEFARENHQDFQSIISSLNQTLDEQRIVVTEQKKVALETEKNTRKQEKLLLLQLHAQCQFYDKSQGMDKKEFQLWKNLIPKKYLKSPVGLEFDRIDADKDGVINVNEFNSLLDKMVENVDL